GMSVEYDSLVNDVTLWNVAVERQIQVKGPEAEAFVNFVITRDATKIPVMRARYVILTNQKGGILNDPVLLRIAEDEFWFSISDSDLMQWLQGVNVGKGFDVEINEIDVAPVQIQGPKSYGLISDLFGREAADIPSYGLYAAQLHGRDVIISQTGFTGEKGYEIYLYDATKYAEDLWNAVLRAGEAHNLRVVAPAHHRRIAAGILSWGQDLDHETLPFQVNLGYQVPRKKEADYIGKTALEAAREQIEAGTPPYRTQLVGLKFAGNPIDDYAPDFWLVSDTADSDPVGYVTSPWYSPELETNVALAHVPVERTALGEEYWVHLPEQYAEVTGEPIRAEIVEVPFRPSVNPNTRERLKAQGLDAAV
ncbi:MAG TPA: aminomethyl transferase family protein, partial [Candidatus Agrococcus pullicola]|nr:aminomethyl transferase family protein [Candidatus Agrococcus pullicola]